MKVYAAINAVQGELALAGIAKDRKNTQQGYNFRGIDDVYNALSPLLAKHGLCILPRILTRSVEEKVTQKGGVLFYVTVEAEFDFVAAEDGSTHVVRTFGEAMDSGDKATNKAMSAAYKYAAFQAFAIPTEGDNDADSHTHQLKAEKPGQPTDGAWDGLTPEQVTFINQVGAYIPSLGTDYKAAAEYLRKQALESEEEIALWTLLDSKTRNGIKKALEGK